MICSVRLGFVPLPVLHLSLSGWHDLDLSKLKGVLQDFQDALQSLKRVKEELARKSQEVRQEMSDTLKDEERILVTKRIRQLLGWDS